MELTIVLLELGVVLAAILVGVRTGGIGLGIWGFVGLFVLVFGFHADPGSPPVDVVFIIIAAITAASVMEAAGGISWMVLLAAKLLRKHPRAIVFAAPAVAFLFTVGAGTGNVYYALLPIIYDVSYSERIRPERPIAVATVASQAAVICSPVSAATAAAVVLLGGDGFDLAKILIVTWGRASWRCSSPPWSCSGGAKSWTRILTTSHAGNAAKCLLSRFPKPGRCLRRPAGPRSSSFSACC